MQVPIGGQSHHEGLRVQPLQYCGHGRRYCEANPQCDSRTCAAAAHYVDNPATEVCASGPCSAATGGECCGSGCASSLCNAAMGREYCEASPTCDSITRAADAHSVNNHASTVCSSSTCRAAKDETDARLIRSVIPEHARQLHTTWTTPLRRLAHPAPAVLPHAENAVSPVRRVP